MRTTVNLDDELMARAMALSGIDEKTQVLHEALRSLIAREAGRRLAKVGGTAPRLPRDADVAAGGAPDHDVDRARSLSWGFGAPADSRWCARRAGVRPRRTQGPADAAPVFRTGTTAVLLDIVVRDKRGRPIRDLRQDEITVLEDGAPREVKSFRLDRGRARRRRPVHARLGRRPARSAAPGHARLAGLRPPGPERPQAGAEGGAGLLEEAAPDRAVGGGVLARQPAAHAAGLLAQRRRAVRGGRSRDDDRRARRTPRRCRGRAGSRPGPSSTGRPGGWCRASIRRPPAPTRWRSRCAR